MISKKGTAVVNNQLCFNKIFRSALFFSAVCILCLSSRIDTTILSMLEDPKVRNICEDQKKLMDQGMGGPLDTLALDLLSYQNPSTEVVEYFSALLMQENIATSLQAIEYLDKHGELTMELATMKFRKEEDSRVLAPLTVALLKIEGNEKIHLRTNGTYTAFKEFCIGLMLAPDKELYLKLLDMNQLEKIEKALLNYYLSASEFEDMMSLAGYFEVGNEAR